MSLNLYIHNICHRISVTKQIYIVLMNKGVFRRGDKCNRVVIHWRVECTCVYRPRAELRKVLQNRTIFSTPSKQALITIKCKLCLTCSWYCSGVSPLTLSPRWRQTCATFITYSNFLGCSST